MESQSSIHFINSPFATRVDRSIPISTPNQKVASRTIHEETTPNQPRFMNRHPDVRRRRRLSTNELVVVVVSARVSLSRVRDNGNIGRDEERVVAETYAVAYTPTIESTR